MATQGRKNQKYSIEVKQEAVRRINDGESLRQVATALGSVNKTQVVEWARKTENGQSLTPAKPKGRPKTNFASPEEELKHLRLEVAYLKKLQQIQRGNLPPNK